MTDTIKELWVEDETMRINLGPQHPSTHGVLRLRAEVSGETVVDVEPIIGYLHTGIEKQAETLNWIQCVTDVTRADYLSNFFNELAYCTAVEKLAGVDQAVHGHLGDAHDRGDLGHGQELDLGQGRVDGMNTRRVARLVGVTL